MPANQGDNKPSGNGRKPPPVETRWKPGQSGNPKGRPKGTGLTDRLRKILDEPVAEGSDKTQADLLMEVAVQAARRGDYRFWAEILNRIDGKVPDKLTAEMEGISVVFRMPDGSEVSTDEIMR